MLNVLKDKLGEKWVNFNTIHTFLLSLNPNIGYRVFPVYVLYFLEDEVIAITYFRGKLASGDLLDIGLSLKRKPDQLSFVSAKYMKYPGINYSIKLRSKDKVKKQLVKQYKKINFNKQINGR